MTDKEKATNLETLLHIQKVAYFINKIVKELLDRAEAHDQSKLVPPELEAFAEVTELLAGSTYGSKEYEDNKKRLDQALAHHYANNRHHPEHFENGIRDMNLIDVIEMFCDWKAATLRHNDGNIRKSIEHNAARFKIGDDLVNIFKNTADWIDS